MLYTVGIVFIVIFALEAAVIIIGNVFTIFVFKTQSALHLKRTSFLLINLAVADLLVAVGEVIVLVIHRIPRTDIRSYPLWWSVQVLGMCVSVMFLALISLERVYAVFWPLRHRVTSVRPYIFSNVIVWVIGFCTTGLSLIGAYVDTVYPVAAANFLLFISLVIICASYLSIRSRLYATKPDLQDGQRKNNTKPECASFKNILRSSRCVAYILAAWFPFVHHQRILLALFSPDVAVVC